MKVIKLIILILIGAYTRGNTQDYPVSYRDDIVYADLSKLKIDKEHLLENPTSILFLKITSNEKYLINHLHKFVNLKVLILYKLPNLYDLSLIEQMNQLEILSIENCHLKEFNIIAKNFKKLRILHLWNNELDEVSKNVLNLSELEYLNYGSNNLEELPNKIYKLKKLKKLVLSGNHIKCIDFDVIPRQLEDLDISYNEINKIKIKNQHMRLNILNMQMNSLENINKEFCLIKNLENLNLSSNGLSFLPKETSNLKLKHLDISRNKLSNLPFFQDLITLDIDYNNFDSIPCISLNLRELSVRYNPIKKLPDCLKKIKSLRFLNISYTLIESIPKSLLLIEELNEVIIEGTPIIRNNNLIYNDKNIIKIYDIYH